MYLPPDIKKTFFDHHELDLAYLHNIMSSLCIKDQILADIYFDHVISEHWEVEDGLFKHGQSDGGYGAGLRVVKGEQIGFASTNDLNLNSLLFHAKAAKSFIGRESLEPPKKFSYQPPLHLYTPLSPDYHWSAEEKKNFLLKLDAYTRSLDSRISQVSISLSSSFKKVFIYRDDGKLAWDRRPMLSLHVSVILIEQGTPFTGSSGGGGRYIFDEWKDLQDPQHYAREAVRLAQLTIEAQPAPAGTMPVILGAGWPGVLIHEAVGHGIEADFNRKKTSIYSDAIGTQVASSLCTIIDDGTIPHARGSIGIDDEGEIPTRAVVIENGILKGYLYDRQNAFLMNQHSTGHGRRESSAEMPMPRMTNTFLAPGSSHLEEMLASIKDGIYAVNFGGGSVDITSGQFVFSANEAYRVKNGKILYPVKGATLTGIGPQVLKKISMIGCDLELDPGIGVCGKNGQSVPVSVGQPCVKVDELVVGGTHHAE